MNKTIEHVVMDAITAHHGAFITDLGNWFSHNENWLIWSAFKCQADAMWQQQSKLIADGLRKQPPHYSARTIGEYIRHHTALNDSSMDFKINDHTWPDLARLYMLVYPERGGFFETRKRAAA